MKQSAENLPDFSEPVAGFQKLFVPPLDCILTTEHIVLVDANLDVPWVCIQKFYRLPGEENSEPWMLAALFSWKDPDEPIDYVTGCPQIVAKGHL